MASVVASIPSEDNCGLTQVKDEVGLRHTIGLIVDVSRHAELRRSSPACVAWQRHTRLDSLAEPWHFYGPAQLALDTGREIERRCRLTVYDKGLARRFTKAV